MFRTMQLLMGGLALAALAVPGAASARDLGRERPVVRVAPDVASEWVLQLSPGSGARPGYRRPVLGERPRSPSGVVYALRPPETAAAIDPRGMAVFSVPVGPDAYPPERTRPRMRSVSVAPAERVLPRNGFNPVFLPRTVEYATDEAPGTIVIDTEAKFLYVVEPGGMARRYGVGVGKPGFEWAGVHRVSAKREWPEWRPPSQMIEREAKRGRRLPMVMHGGIENPLGARALYLGSTLYRIHGTNQPWSIGKAVSSGCIRMRNQDVIELYKHVPVGTKVVVL